MISINNREITPTMFPDGTSQVWKLPEELLATLGDVTTINWHFTSEAELLHIAQLKDLLSLYTKYQLLYIDYLPYARQDKEVSNITTFSLTSFASLLNSLKFSRVDILDPHSSVALKLINNSRVVTAAPYIYEAIYAIKCDMIIYPDEGAQLRYGGDISFPSITAYKTRDSLTGHIISLDIDTRRPLPPTLLIVDDICDGGATFISLTKLLGDSSIHLYTTHGLYSKGVDILYRAGIKSIWNKRGLYEQPTT